MKTLLEPQTVAIIDGNSLMHRAFHAVQAPMTAPDGTPTNAVFGFISMFLKLVHDFSPDVVVCAFDIGRPLFRMEILEAYKAQRPPTDPNLKVQFPLIQNLLRTMNVPVVMSEGWEGDDILGTLAHQAEEAGLEVFLVTGDRDAMQLVTEKTHILRTLHGMSEIGDYDSARVLEEFGVTPAQIPDYLGLKGDASDNIPGVPGVGEKKARALLQEFGSLEGVLQAADDGLIKGKMGESLRASHDIAFDSRKVATISREAPVSVDFADSAFPNFDVQAVRDAFGKLKLYSHMKKIVALMNGRVSPEPSASSQQQETDAMVASGESVTDVTSESPSFAEVTISYEPVFTGDEALEELKAAIARGEWISASFEDKNQGSLFPEKELVLGFSSGFASFGEEKLSQVISFILKEGKLVAHDMKTLLGCVYPPSLAETSHIKLGDIKPKNLFDVSLAAYLLDAGRREYSLDLLADRYLGETVPTPSDDLSLALISASFLRELQPVLAHELEHDESKSCFENIELPLVLVLLEMERNGAYVDSAFLKQLGDTTAQTIESLRSQITDYAGHDFNVDSPMQLSSVLFEELGLPTPRKKTKTGYSTNAEVLQNLVGVHPIAELVLEYRNLAKIKSTYIDTLPAIAAEATDHRVHSSFNQYITATGRLSSANPNLQNIPVRTEFGRQIRQAFVPQDANSVFLSADYSQIELRLLAHLSGDEGLISAFKSGYDFHAATASAVFGIPLEQITPEQRSQAKAVNFGIVYGQQAFGLAMSLGISQKEAAAIISKYFATYPAVREYLDGTVASAKETGYASTMHKRKRHIAELQATNANLRAFGERTAMNHPVQGSAADIIKLAMIEVDRRMKEAGLKSRLIIQVHDELDFEVPKDELEELIALVTDAMTNIVALRVPLEVSVEYGASWAEAK